jgi:uncharacterized protein YkwD
LSLLSGILRLAVDSVVPALLKLLKDSVPQEVLGLQQSASQSDDSRDEDRALTEHLSDVSGVRQLEMRMAGLINMERKRNADESQFAKPLQWDEDVAEVARSHSLAMLQDNFCGHTNSEGEDHAARLLKAGMDFTMSAENVANGFETIEATMAAFMDEPPFTRHTHRFNILNPELSHVGVGIVEDHDGRLVVTQNFVRR